MTGWISGRRKSAEIADVEQGKNRVYKLVVGSSNAAIKLDSSFRRNDFNLMTPRKLSRVSDLLLLSRGLTAGSS